MNYVKRHGAKKINERERLNLCSAKIVEVNLVS